MSSWVVYSFLERAQFFILSSCCWRRDSSIFITWPCGGDGSTFIAQEGGGRSILYAGEGTVQYLLLGLGGEDCSAFIAGEDGSLTFIDVGQFTNNC